MRSYLRLALLALPLAGTVLCSESPSQTKDVKPSAGNTHEAFRELLNALPEESLHVALHSLADFKDGVFESDRHGVERVHRENPPLATKLIVAAVQDLRKRQNPTNGTMTSRPSEPETSQEPEPSQDSSSEDTPEPPRTTSRPPPPPPAVEVPVTVTQTMEGGQTTVVKSVIRSAPTASVIVTRTITNDAGETEVATVTQPGVVVTMTDTAGSTVTTTSAVEWAPTPGQKLTSTNSEGSTITTTYTPDGGKVSSIKLITTTGNDGQPSVVTEYTYVEFAQASVTDGESSPTGTAGGKPGLQSGAAQKNRAMEAAMIGGAVGGVFALWI